MAGISEPIEFRARRSAGSAALGRLLDLARDRSDAGAARRFAALAFVARVVNAGLGFGTQVLLARWMGDREYGIYAYLWVWLLVAGGVGSLGLPVAALKLVPDYTARRDWAGLRGFLAVARGVALVPATLAALLAGGAFAAFASGEAASYLPATLVVLVVLPLYVLTDIQTGIARAYDFADLGLAADYLLRPILLLAFAALVHVTGWGGTASTIMTATLAAMAATTVIQGVLLHARLHARVPAGPRRLDYGRWTDLSWPLLTVTAFTLLLGSTDILVLKLFVGPEEIALYFAATKIIAIASFVSYGVANTSAHRFAAHIAGGDTSAMAALAAETVRWTFWPTLAVACGLAVVGIPLLSLFGPQFAAGYPVVLILGLGLVAGATVGPADRALAMADHGRLTASIYAVSFGANLVLAIALTPLFGLTGAAASTALAMAGRAVLLRRAARNRLGLDMFVFARAALRADVSAESTADRLETQVLPPSAVNGLAAEWRDLAERALEPNVFYGFEIANAGVQHLPEGRDASILAVWRNVSGTRRLVGVLPVVTPRGRYFNPFRIRRAAAFYGTLSTPLMDPDRPGETLRAMLRALNQHGVSGLLLPFLHLGGPVALALDELSMRSGKPWVSLDTHRRAFLRSNLRGADYTRATLEPRRRKEADRQRRRLAEQGTLAFSIATEPVEVARDLEAFLQLETAGWKGKSGTDLIHAAGAAAFVREAASTLSATRSFRVGTLTLDGRVIAAGYVGVSQRRAFYLRTTYDESLARFSPGFLLTLDLTAHLLDDLEIEDADSIAVADHPMIDRVWTERFPVGSVLVATRSGGGRSFRAALAAERVREGAIARLKNVSLKVSEFRKGRAKQSTKKRDAEDAV